MSDPTGATRDGQDPPVSAGYEPPRVEQVLTPADLEREMLYGGPAISPDEPG